MNEVNEMLEKLLKELEDKAAPLDDKGHTKLLTDLKGLLANTLEGKYHDFHANGLPSPKVGLVQHLMTLIERTKNGEYDN